MRQEEEGGENESLVEWKHAEMMRLSSSRAEKEDQYEKEDLIAK